MLYELRHYDVCSQCDLLALMKRFQNHTVAIWDRIGIEPVGFWPVLVGTPTLRLTYLLVWENLAQREQLWDQFNSDPEWNEARTLTTLENGGSPVKTITSSILRPTEFSRLPRHNNQPSRYAGGVFELRSYRFDDPDKLTETADWFANFGLAHLEKHKMYAMGFWTTYLGVSPQLTYMLVFETMADREQAWASFYTDPAWQNIQKGLYPDNRPLIQHMENCLMKGTDFSGWR